MTEYRYHRMASNVIGWKRPHGGRLGHGKDYVAEQGIGHEDWNFANDVWEDGRYHLYLRQSPKQADIKETFNLVLGVHTKIGPMVVGFAENVTYAESDLPKKIWQRRAREVLALDASGQLGDWFCGKSLSKISQILAEGRYMYNVSVAQGDLIILNHPMLIPDDDYKVSTPMYRLLPMTAKEYAALKELSVEADIAAGAAIDDTSFPEGALVEKLHRSRERNKKLVKAAKDAFVAKHGALHCEACGMKPHERFKDPSLAVKIIEAHHNVALTDPAHKGQTKVADLSMLCPTCHRAIHTIRPWLKVEDLRKRLGR